MYWFILLFPILIFPWGIERYYTMPKYYYLEIFVLCTWLYIVLKGKAWKPNLEKPYLSVEVIIIIFLSLIGISTIFSVNPMVSVYGKLDRYEGLLAFTSYASVLLFSYRLINEQRLEKAISGMAIVSVLVSIYGILQHYSLDFLPRNPANYYEIRSYGFFDNPNFFGSYLVIIMMITISLYLRAIHKKPNLFYFFTISLAFIALILSGTRSGWVGVFCGMLFVTMFVVWKRKYLWKKWAALLITLTLLVIVINATEKGSYFSRINSVFSDSYHVVTGHSTGQEGSYRFFIWKKSLSLIKPYFWLGSGPDTFQYVFPNDKEKEEIFGDIGIDKAHNEYLQMAITLGVPALLTYLYLLFVVTRRAYQAVRRVRGDDKKIILYGLISTIISYLVQAFFNISVVTVAPLFWSILGITMAISAFYVKNEMEKNLSQLSKGEATAQPRQA